MTSLSSAPSSSLHLLSADWPAPTHVRAYATTNPANMALHVGDDPEKVLANRAQLTQQLNLTQPICWLEQQHTTLVVKADHWQQPPIADAVWTDQPGLACAVMTADCLPVLFTDIKGEKVAAAHAGWRGLLNGILENTVTAMNVDPTQLMAWFGPAISQAAFEVGDEVRDAFVAQDSEASAAFMPSKIYPKSLDLRRGAERSKPQEHSISYVTGVRSDGNKASDSMTKGMNHWLADLYQLARLRLNKIGLMNCFGGDYCTYTQSDLFFSYRRLAKTGRMASLIWFDPPNQKS